MVVVPRYREYEEVYDTDVRVTFNVLGHQTEIGYFHCTGRRGLRLHRSPRLSPRARQYLRRRAFGRHVSEFDALSSRVGGGVARAVRGFRTGMKT